MVRCSLFMDFKLLTINDIRLIAHGICRDSTVPYRLCVHLTGFNIKNHFIQTNTDSEIVDQ
jgi:hypothetical protein